MEKLVTTPSPILLPAVSCSASLHHFEDNGNLISFSCGYCNSFIPLKAYLALHDEHPEWPERKLAMLNREQQVTMCSKGCYEMFSYKQN